MKQISLLKPQSKSYGGELLKTRNGRSSGRPLATRQTMHLVLRSSKAQKEMSFHRPEHARKIKEIVDKFSKKYGVKVISLANVGNHLHFHIQLAHRAGYYKFIRAITSAIAMSVSGVNRWTKSKTQNALSASTSSSAQKGFWDYRPFTRVVAGMNSFLKLRDYIQVNQLEGLGVLRIQARYYISQRDHYSLQI